MSTVDVTGLLRAAREGDGGALERLLPLLYDELRAIAARALGGEAPGHTLQPTALVHEAYLRLLDAGKSDWENRAHFLGYAAHMIRRVLVEHARSRGRLKRGGGQLRVTISDGVAATPAVDLDLLALDEALERLGKEDEVDRKIVELRFFGGLSVSEVASVLDVSERTVHRRWAFVRTWLYRQLKPRPPETR